MKVEELLIDPEKSISLGDQAILINLFKWLLHPLEDYDTIERIFVRNHIWLSIKRKGMFVLESYPLFTTVVSRLMPALMEEFRLARHLNRGGVANNPVLRELSTSPEVFYEYYNLHGKLPITLMLQLRSFIVEQQEISSGEFEEDTTYKSTARLVT